MIPGPTPAIYRLLLAVNSTAVVYLVRSGAVWGILVAQNEYTTAVLIVVTQSKGHLINNKTSIKKGRLRYTGK